MHVMAIAVVHVVKNAQQLVVQSVLILVHVYALLVQVNAKKVAIMVVIQRAQILVVAVVTIVVQMNVQDVLLVALKNAPILV